MIVKVFINLDNFKLIEDYLQLCCLYFKNLIQNKFPQIDFNIENDNEFKEKFELFLEKDLSLIIETISLEKFQKMFEFLDDYLKNVDETKLKWIIFSFIKWNHLYLQNDFIVIENLLSDINSPAIVDFKLGKEEKIGKEKTSMEKIKHSTSNKYGFRMMGSQVKLFKLSLIT